MIVSAGVGVPAGDQALVVDVVGIRTGSALYVEDPEVPGGASDKSVSDVLTVLVISLRFHPCC